MFGRKTKTNFEMELKPMKLDDHPSIQKEKSKSVKKEEKWKSVKKEEFNSVVEEK